MNKSEIVVDGIVCRIYTAHDDPKSSISLPSSFSARVELAQAGINGYASTIAPYQAKNMKLPLGKYRAVVTVGTSENINRFSCIFLVTEESEVIKWETEIGKHKHIV